MLSVERDLTTEQINPAKAGAKIDWHGVMLDCEQYLHEGRSSSDFINQPSNSNACCTLHYRWMGFGMMCRTYRGQCYTSGIILYQHVMEQMDLMPACTGSGCHQVRRGGLGSSTGPLPRLMPHPVGCWNGLVIDVADPINPHGILAARGIVKSSLYVVMMSSTISSSYRVIQAPDYEDIIAQGLRSVTLPGR